MAKYKVTIIVDETKLLQVYKDASGEDVDKTDLPDAIRQELGWALESGISVDSIEEQNEENELLTRLGECISNDEFGDDKAILEFLRNADEKTLNENAHGYEFEAYAGCEIEIVMWQPLEHFTLRMLASHIGL